jgi:hypothetical protein
MISSAEPSHEIEAATSGDADTDWRKSAEHSYDERSQGLFNLLFAEK